MTNIVQYVIINIYMHIFTYSAAFNLISKQASLATIMLSAVYV